MSPKRGAMTMQVFQDQVDGLGRVFGSPALGALAAQRSLEALERRSDLVELLRRGVFLFEPENSAQTVKQIGAFGKSLQKQEERRLIFFKRAQHALESFQRFSNYRPHPFSHKGTLVFRLKPESTSHAQGHKGPQRPKNRPFLRASHGNRQKRKNSCGSGNVKATEASRLGEHGDS